MVTVKVKKNRGYTRGVAFGGRDEDIPPSRPDSPGGPEVSRKKCPCGEYHPEPDASNILFEEEYEPTVDFFYGEESEDYIDDGSIYSPGTAAGIAALESLVSVDNVQEPLTFREREYIDLFDETCVVCSTKKVDHTQFIMPCSPEALVQSYMQQYLTVTPSGWMATDSPDGIMLTANGREEYYLLCDAEKQDRAAHGERWSWCCRRVGTKADKCDNDFMRDISS